MALHCGAMVPPELAPRPAYLEPVGEGKVHPHAPLSWVFGQVYDSLRPASVLVTPLGELEVFEGLDSSFTRRAVGIDRDMEKVAVARQRYRRLGPAMELYCADALRARLQPEADFGLVYVAPPLVGASPERLAAAIAGWVAPGGTCAVVSRLDLESEEGWEPGPALADFLSAQGLRRAGAWIARRGGLARARVSLFRAGPK